MSPGHTCPDLSMFCVLHLSQSPEPESWSPPAHTPAVTLTLTHHLNSARIKAPRLSSWMQQPPPGSLPPPVPEPSCACNQTKAFQQTRVGHHFFIWPVSLLTLSLACPCLSGPSPPPPFLPLEPRSFPQAPPVLGAGGLEVSQVAPACPSRGCGRVRAGLWLEPHPRSSRSCAASGMLARGLGTQCAE